VSQIIWPPNALWCVQRLHNFLKDKNPSSAQRVIKALRDGVTILRSFPNAGILVKDMGNGRFLLVKLAMPFCIDAMRKRLLFSP